MTDETKPKKKITKEKAISIVDDALWKFRADINAKHNIDIIAELDGYDPAAKYEHLEYYYDNDENEWISLMHEEPPTKDDYTEDGMLKPQFKWKPIPWVQAYRKNIPFGYKQREDDPNILDPIPFELEVLELGKQHVKKYSYHTVAEWITEVTGRKINYNSLWRRYQLDKQKDKRARAARKWASRYKSALRAAEKIELEEAGAGRPRPYDYEGNRNDYGNPRPLARPVLGAGAFRDPSEFDDGTPSEHGYDEAVKGKRRTGPRCPRSTHPHRRSKSGGSGGGGVQTESGSSD